jgi:NO-binding membrane sensor protein with MHYT domain
MNITNDTIGNSTFLASNTDVYSIWNPFFVVLSLCISTIGAFTTLQMLIQFRHAEKIISLILWMVAGAFSLAVCGVWSMHVSLFL